jgi:CRP-like cAMP-binding protein
MASNVLLERLPPAALARLQPRLETVPLHKGQTLFEAGEPVRYLHFPTSGLVSLVGITLTGGMVELATVANDGVVGLPIILHARAAPCLATVQIAGSAFRLRADAFDADLRANAVLHDALLEYAHQHVAEVSQAVVCQCFHSVLQRLCRWLLTATDRLKTDTLELTQENLALILGVLRSGITEAAGELQDADAIRARYGRIVIRNRLLLQRSACECYHPMDGVQPRVART